MDKLTITQKEQYLKNTFNCPFCNSADIRGIEFDADFNQAWRKIKCYSCGKKWHEIFTITDIEEIKS